RIGRAYVQKHPKPPTLTEVAKLLVKNEIEKSNDQDVQRTLASGVQVALPPTKPSPKSPTFTLAKQRLGKPTRTVRASEDVIAQSVDSTPRDTFSLASLVDGNRSPNASRWLAKGNILFGDGATYARGYDEVVISHGYGDLLITQ